MKDRRKINRIVFVLVGFGLPIYYKTRFILAGQLSFSDLELIPTLVDFIFPLSLSWGMVKGYSVIEQKYFVKENGENSFPRLIVKMILLAILAIIVTIAYTRFFFTYISPYPIGYEMLFDFSLASLSIPLLVNGVGMSLHFYEGWKSETSQRELLEKENLKARFEILKNQINPHFLFNSFNTLSVLISESQAKADSFLKHLAKVYRFVLEVKEKELIRVREELEVMQSYVHLMKTRLGDKLRVNMNIPESQQEYYIPPLTLQILMENALKHNKATSESPLTINIGLSDDNEIDFVNSLNKIENVPSTNIGLKNIIDRYQYLSESGVKIEQDNLKFSVSVPLIKVDE